MKPVHAALAVLVAAMESFTPPQLTALRFMAAAVAALWLPRPNISWTTLVSIGLTVFTGQFLFQFFGIAGGMPPGLTAVVVQTQALFTVLFAAFLIGDKPSVQQVIGMLTSFVGLTMIGLTLGASVPSLAFALTLASAVSWATGNVLVKRLPKINMLHLMVWASLVPPIPALGISFLLDGPRALPTALAQASWLGLLAPVYLDLLASVFAYAAWGYLLQRYSTGSVAPFALLAPAVGAIASSIVFGETFGPLRLAGMACMVIGLAVVVFPKQTVVLAFERLGVR